MLFRVVFGGPFFLAGLGLTLASARRLRKSVAVLRARTRPVADLSPGDLATVEGEAVALTDDRVPAHFLDAVGVAVATRVEGKSRTSAGGGPPGGGVSTESWSTKHTHFEAVPFAVDDGTGAVEIRSPSVEDYPTESSFRESMRLDERTRRDGQVSPGTAVAYDDHVGEDAADGRADRRFHQGVLRPGATVTAQGRIVETDDGDLVLGHRRNPDAFTLATRSTPSAVRQLLGGVALGVVGLQLLVVGGAVLLTLVPAVEMAVPSGFPAEVAVPSRPPVDA